MTYSWVSHGYVQMSPVETQYILMTLSKPDLVCRFCDRLLPIHQIWGWFED
jgi:hypothetical protein